MMNTKTQTRLMHVVFALGAIATVVVIGRIGGAIANILPPEVLVSLAAIAGLLGHAIIELRQGAPRGYDRGFRRRFQRDFLKPRAKIVPMWQHDHRAAA